MSRFSDRLGREWTLGVTMGSADQVQQDTGIDLLRWIEDAGGADNRTVFRIVGSLCADQIAAAGLTARQFADGFDGPTLERAGAALVEALLFFSLPQRVATAAVPKLRQAAAEITERAAAAIEGRGSSPSDGLTPASAGSTPAP